MILTYEEQDRYLLRIFTGKEIVVINDYFLAVFKYPTNSIRLKANIKYDICLKHSKEEGFLTREEIEKVLCERKMYTPEDDIAIEKIKSKIEAQKVVLSKTVQNMINKGRIEEVIKKYEIDIRNIEKKKLSLLAMSCESKAEEERLLYTCWECSYNAETEDKIWGDFNSMLSEKNIGFRNSVLNSFLLFFGGLSNTVIRLIARSNLWRIRYINSMKTSEPLFGVPCSEYNVDMINLSYWSNFYQNVYEMMPEDRPSDIIIVDDMALDSYMRAYYEEKEKEYSGIRGNKATKGNLSAFDKEEVIVTQAHELYQELKYDKPREAQKIKNKSMISKRTNHV